jgi:hypothetical protein
MVLADRLVLEIQHRATVVAEHSGIGTRRLMLNVDGLTNLPVAR